MKAIKDRFEHLFYQTQDRQESSSGRSGPRANRPVSREDIVRFYFRPDSIMFRSYKERLGWGHQYYLKWLATGSTKQLYHSNRVQSLDGLLSKEDWIKGWKQIAVEGLNSSIDDAVHSLKPFLDDTEDNFNEFHRILQVVLLENIAREWLNDDDMVHYEQPPSRGKSNRCGMKITKHSRDNRWRFIHHVVGCSALCFAVNILTEREGTGVVSNMKTQCFGSLFGGNPLISPNLSGHNFKFDRGYTGEETIKEVIIPSRADVLGSAKRGKYLGYHFGEKVKEDDREIVKEAGAMTYMIKERYFGEGGQRRKVPITRIGLERERAMLY